MPQIAVIIPTVNYERITNLIGDLIANKEPLNIIIIKNNYAGFAKAINFGVKQALINPEIEVIILMNDDIRLHGYWLEALKSKTEDIICDKHMLREEHCPFYYVYIKREVFEKIGLLDERFEIGQVEDVDFCIRAIESGFKLAETDTKHITHKASITLDKLNEGQKEKVKQNKEKFLEKYKGTKWEYVYGKL